MHFKSKYVVYYIGMSARPLIDIMFTRKNIVDMVDLASSGTLEDRSFPPSLKTRPGRVQKSIDLLLHDFDSLPTVEQRKGWWCHISPPCRDNLRIVWITLSLKYKIGRSFRDIGEENKRQKEWGRRGKGGHYL